MVLCAGGERTTDAIGGTIDEMMVRDEYYEGFTHNIMFMYLFKMLLENEVDIKLTEKKIRIACISRKKIYERKVLSQIVVGS